MAGERTEPSAPRVNAHRDSLETAIARRTENAGFTCAHCGGTVPPLTNGSYRNHCPYCLYSVHVDRVPGDRASGCGGLMRPVALRGRPGRHPQLLHGCERCGAVRANRAAFDTAAPDDLDLLLALPPG